MTLKIMAKPDSTSKLIAPDYPCLKCSRSSGVIVLFTSECTGTVVETGNSNFGPGFHSVGWDSKMFNPYYGEVTLKQERRYA